MEFLKKHLWLPIILGVLILAVIFITNPYNQMVAMDESVKTAWSQVENQYQRRWDLIPNLVETVKGYAAHESETLTAVVEARAKATQSNINIKDAQALAEFQQNQTGLSSALSRLMVVAEQYPELKANQNFLELQAQLEGTENRITVARQDYNMEVKTYNTYIRQFPKNITAAFFGFERANLFETAPEAESAPKVEF